MEAIVTNTISKKEWVVELIEPTRYEHVLSYTTCEDVAYALKFDTETYCKAAEKYGGNQIRTQMYHLLPKKNRMVFSIKEDAIKFKEDWVEPKLMAIQLTNIK